MPALDDLQNALLEARRGQNLERIAKRFDSLADRVEISLGSEQVTEFKNAFRALAKAMQRLNDGLAPKLESLDPVLSAVSSLRKDVQGMTKAIESIEIPAPPPFPEIPKLDLTPVSTEIDGLYEVISNIRLPEPVVQRIEPPPQAKKEFEVYAIERGPAGYVRSAKFREI